MFERDPTTATIGAEILPLEVKCLPEFFWKKGEVELNYTPKMREQSLLDIKREIKKNDAVKDIKISDEVLLIFLTSRKYHIERTFTQLTKFVKFKRTNSNLFNKPSFEALSAFMTSEFITLLPWRCQDGCAVILIQLNKYKTSVCPVETVKQFYVILLTQCLREPMTQINGFKVIFDLNITLDAVKLCSLQNLRLFYYGTQVVLPGRFKAIHIINMGVAGRTVFHLIKMFFSEKLKKRVHVHENVGALLDYFPKSILPVKLGGDQKNCDMTEWLKKVTSPESLSFMDF